MKLERNGEKQRLSRRLPINKDTKSPSHRDKSDKLIDKERPKKLFGLSLCQRTKDNKTFEPQNFFAVSHKRCLSLSKAWFSISIGSVTEFKSQQFQFRSSHCVRDCSGILLKRSGKRYSGRPDGVAGTPKSQQTTDFKKIKSLEIKKASLYSSNA